MILGYTCKMNAVSISTLGLKATLYDCVRPLSIVNFKQILDILEELDPISMVKC